MAHWGEIPGGPIFLHKNLNNRSFCDLPVRGRPSKGGHIMTKDEIVVVTQLQRQGFGYRRIAALTNIPLNTIKSYCRRHPVAESADVTLSEDVCRQCGQPIESVPHRKAKQFCSDKCRMTWWNSHRNLVNRKAYQTVVCGNCGTAFQVYGNVPRKFCSRACSAASRRKAVDA